MTKSSQNLWHIIREDVHLLISGPGKSPAGDFWGTHFMLPCPDLGHAHVQAGEPLGGNPALGQGAAP